MAVTRNHDKETVRRDGGAREMQGDAGVETSFAGLVFKDRDEPIYTISIATRLVRPAPRENGRAARPLHAQTLRMYEREGLIKPKRVGRNRLYSDRDIERLRQIQHLTQDLGVNLAGVEIILDLMEQMEDLKRKVSG